MVDEVERLAALRRLDVLDTAGEAELDEVVALAARIFDAPTALISLADSDRLWFKARFGLDPAQTPRELAFCERAIMQSRVLLVEDATADPRFRENPLVLGAPHLRFYAGAPPVTSGAAAIGSLCVLDTRVPSASAHQQAMLLALADQVVKQLETRAGHHPGPAHPRRGLDQPVAVRQARYLETTADGVIVDMNAAAARTLGSESEELIGRSSDQIAHPDHPRDTDSAIEAQSLSRSSYEATRVYRHRTGRAVEMRPRAVPPVMLRIIGAVRTTSSGPTLRPGGRRAGRDDRDRPRDT